MDEEKPQPEKKKKQPAKRGKKVKVNEEEIIPVEE